MDIIDYYEIGCRIRAIRESKGLSQEKMSEQCDITAPYYGNIERGDRKMSVETLIKLVKGLGVSADEILFYNNPYDTERFLQIVRSAKRTYSPEQFEKYLIIISQLAEIIDQL